MNELLILFSFHTELFGLVTCYTGIPSLHLFVYCNLFAVNGIAGTGQKWYANGPQGRGWAMAGNQGRRAYTLCTYFQSFLLTKLLPVSKVIFINEACRTDRRRTLANVLSNNSFPNVCVHHCLGFSTHLVSTASEKSFPPLGLNSFKFQSTRVLPFSVQCSADIRRTIVFLEVTKASTACPSDKIGVKLNTSMTLYWGYLIILWLSFGYI
jgi:hypothetical protein